VNPMYIVYRT